MTVCSIYEKWDHSHLYRVYLVTIFVVRLKYHESIIIFMINIIIIIIIIIVL